MRLRQALFIFTITMLASCTLFDTDTQLEDALAMAGENRSELEKVLDHYENDSLKLEAAKFLISNMPGHYSIEDTATLKAYSVDVDSILSRMTGRDHKEIRDSIDSCAARYDIANMKKVFDIKIMTSDYLIRNIDDAFEQWEKGNWARHLDFEEFCEYLLPYKVDEGDALDDWRYRLKTFYAQTMHELDYSDTYNYSSLAAAKMLNQCLHDGLRPDHATTLRQPRMTIEVRAKVPFASCDDYAVIASATMRSQGIPIIRDFTPQWAYRSSGHSWNVVLANDGKEIPFSGVCTTPGDNHKLDEKMAKAYRKTYAINHQLLQLTKEERHVPSLFKSPFFKDVTAKYISCSDVKLPVKAHNIRHAYLAIFNDTDWEPVAYAKVNSGNALFKDMGKNVMYIMIGYDDNGKQQILSNPFLLQYDGGVKEYAPVHASKTSLQLKRKYPVLDYLYTSLSRLEGGEFQASNDPTFTDRFLIHKIKDCHAFGYDIPVNDSIPPCRYWRYYTNRKAAFFNMAEIYLYPEKSSKPAYGQVIGLEGSWGDNKERTREKAFDGDILTFFDAPEPDESWAGMDMGKPVKIDRIVYYGRGDGNAIEIGDTYELYYWDNGVWKSLGKKKAVTPTLRYDGVPSNALYLLKDLTKGKDHRIFTYEDGKQIWW